jgi:hypothetical protein
MNILGALKKLLTALLSISFLYFMVMPILNFMGVQIPHDVTNLTSSVILLISLAIIVAVLIMLGLGYCALTGWRNYKALPKVVRILLAFILGVAIFFLTGPLSILLPIPLLPLVVATVLLWTVLRALSNLIIKGEGGQRGVIDLEKAFFGAKSFLKKWHLVSGEELALEECKMVDDGWEIVLSSKSSRFRLRLDKTGSVSLCERLS